MGIGLARGRCLWEWGRLEGGDGTFRFHSILEGWGSTMLVAVVLVVVVSREEVKTFLLLPLFSPWGVLEVCAHHRDGTNPFS